MTIPPAWPAFMPPQPLPFPIADASAMPGEAKSRLLRCIFFSVIHPLFLPQALQGL